MTTTVTVPWTFRTQSGEVPARELDEDFDALANAINGTTAPNLTVACISLSNITLPTPGTLPFVVDGYTVRDQDLVFLNGQTDEIENGAYIYDLSATSLARSAQMDSGQTITAPFTVYIRFGDDDGDTYWTLDQTAFTVGVDINTWTLTVSTGQQPGTFLAGPYKPYVQPAPATYRVMSPTDLFPYTPFRQQTTFPQSIYLNLNNFGFMSRYLDPSNPWRQRDLLTFVNSQFNTVVFDQTVYLVSAPTGPFTGKEWIFTGSGFTGNKVVMTGNGRFLDPGGSVDFSLKGPLCIEYLNALNTSRAIEPLSSFTRLTIEDLWTRGANYAFFCEQNHLGLTLGSSQVYNYPTNTPFHMVATGSVYVGRLPNIARFGGTTTNATVTYNANVNSPIFVDTATLSADHVLNLAVDNVADNSTLLYQCSTSGGHTRNVTDVATSAILFAATTGKWAQFGFDRLAGTPQWKLLSDGTL